MRNLILATAAVGALSLSATAVQAAEDPEVAVRASTLGLGITAGVKVLPHVRVRGLANGLNINYDDTVDDIHYDGKFKLGSVGLQADFFPLDEGPFYLTAGIYSNQNKIHATATPTGNTDIGGTTYTPAEIGTITAHAKYNSTAPYLGLGVEFSVYPALINLEAGAYFQGEPDVTLTSNGTMASNPAYQASLDRERQDLQDSLDNTKTWPVVSIGVGFRF
ncbi:MAG: hypothetical protein JF615_04235 [Asticcacaulis sp.]|nr:hypothetical protein [Asticcacaulis sp.]